jgi:hypothetical protein
MTRRNPLRAPRPLIEAIRKACIDAAVAEYELASMNGLCPQGAFEAAVGAVRRADLPTDDSPPAALAGELEEATRSLAARFAAPGPPAAGSAAAATGALAAGLLQWSSNLSASHGPASFRGRADAISGRAGLLASALAAATRVDSEIVGRWIEAAGSPPLHEVVDAATESALQIADRCARVASLAAEVATEGHASCRLDVVTALRLAVSASERALELADGNQTLTRERARRVWRIRLLLQRASAQPDVGEP